jgi:CRISPR/Cas system CMR-associated protein Cmr3 (group 5 of RAMP superfamily)
MGLYRKIYLGWFLKIKEGQYTESLVTYRCDEITGEVFNDDLNARFHPHTGNKIVEKSKTVTKKMDIDYFRFLELSDIDEDFYRYFDGWVGFNQRKDLCKSFEGKITSLQFLELLDKCDLAAQAFKPMTDYLHNILRAEYEIDLLVLENWS